MKKAATHLANVRNGGRVFRYGEETFALLFAGRGRNEVLGDLDLVRGTIEDFRFPVSARAAANGGNGRSGSSAARWSLTVSVGVAERGEKKGWAARYGAIKRLAGGALERAQKAGGNIVSK